MDSSDGFSVPGIRPNTFQRLTTVREGKKITDDAALVNKNQRFVITHFSKNLNAAKAAS